VADGFASPVPVPASIWRTGSARRRGRPAPGYATSRCAGIPGAFHMDRAAMDAHYTQWLVLDRISGPDGQRRTNVWADRPVAFAAVGIRCGRLGWRGGRGLMLRVIYEQLRDIGLRRHGLDGARRPGWRGFTETGTRRSPMACTHGLTGSGRCRRRACLPASHREARPSVAACRRRLRSDAAARRIPGRGPILIVLQSLVAETSHAKVPPTSATPATWVHASPRLPFVIDLWCVELLANRRPVRAAFVGRYGGHAATQLSVDGARLVTIRRWGGVSSSCKRRLCSVRRG
jgi:hypothetical protein